MQQVRSALALSDAPALNSTIVGHFCVSSLQIDFETKRWLHAAGSAIILRGTQPDVYQVSTAPMLSLHAQRMPFYLGACCAEDRSSSVL